MLPASSERIYIALTALGLFVGRRHKRRSHSTSAPDQPAESMAIELKMKIWYSLITIKYHCEKHDKDTTHRQYEYEGILQA